MGMLEDAVKILREYRDSVHEGNTEAAARTLNVPAPTLWRWMNGKAVPSMKVFAPIFDQMGGRLVIGSELEALLKPDMKAGYVTENAVLSARLQGLELENRRLKTENMTLEIRLDELRGVLMGKVEKKRRDMDSKDVETSSSYREKAVG